MKIRKNQERGLERVSHFFLSAPKPFVEKEKVTIQAAARALGVSKGTIITYLNKGLLTRIKEDGRICIEMYEVNRLRERERGAAGQTEQDQSQEPLSHFRQFEKKRQGLPAAAPEAKNKELERLKSELAKLRQDLGAQTSELAETKGKLAELEKEQNKLLFNFDKATDVRDHKRKDTRAKLLAVGEELESIQQPSRKELIDHQLLRPESSGKKRLVLLGILSLLGVLMLSLWWSNLSPTPNPSVVNEGQVYESGTVQATSQPRSPNLEASPSSEKSVSPGLEEGQQDFGLASTPAVYVLRAETLEQTWLHLVIDDNQELEYLLNPDEKHTWRAMSGFRLHIGNAAGLKLYLNDEPLKALGGTGEVVLLKLPDLSLIETSNSEYTETGSSP